MAKPRAVSAMIDILIPSYNRCFDITKNIDLLSERIKEERLQGKFRVLVSDNNSSDGTLNALKAKIDSTPFELLLGSQYENVGLEKNAIALLERATADFIMYIGDDDFLPKGYLRYVVDQVEKDPEIAAVIPGITALHSDGTMTPARDAEFELRKYQKGFSTVLKVSLFGHQLSGILLRREGLNDNYTRQPELRNIYPFVYFLGFNNLRGTTYYAPKFKVLVSVSNSKDWGYDAAGLLTEFLRNYRILFPCSPLKRSLCSLALMHQQSWRLQIGKDVKRAFSAFFLLMTANDIDPLTKIAIPFVYVSSYARKVLGILLKPAVS